MLKRLTFYPIWENGVRRTPGGPTGSAIESCSLVQVVSDGPDSAELDAPTNTTGLSVRSITTMVDYAGWTEAVIQRGRCVLTNHSAGCFSTPAETSFDYVDDPISWEASSSTGSGPLLPAVHSGNRPNRPGVGSPVSSVNCDWVFSLRVDIFSCPNTYEVTL